MSNSVASNLVGTDIRVVYAGIESNDIGGTRYGPVIRSVYILECCTGGCGSVIVNGKEFPVSAGSCYFLLPGDAVIHTSAADTPRQGIWCALDGVSIGTVLESAGISASAPFLDAALYPSVRSLLEQLTQLWSCRDAGAQLRQIACVYGLLGTLLQNKPAQENSSLIDMAIGLMQTHYPSELSVTTLAGDVGLERTYFSELFKLRTGISPYQYLTKLRIQKSCQLLSQGHSITEAAYLVGLEPHNFSRVFKKDLGITPRDYTRKLRNHRIPLVERPACDD